MKVLIIKRDLGSRSEDGDINYEVDEAWIFINEEISLENIINEWKKSKEEFPKLYQYLEFIGGQLSAFDEIIY